MNTVVPIHLLVFISVWSRGEACPKFCTCETAALYRLPINSILIKTQHNRFEKHDPVPTFHKNEVLEEVPEHAASHTLGTEELRAVSCVLQPQDTLAMFLSLPPDTQVLTILQGPGSGNITLDETYFQHLENLVVLEIHGFPHSHNLIRLLNNALKHLSVLQYLNLQYVQLLGAWNVGNRPAPQLLTQNLVHGAISIGEMEQDNDLVVEPIKIVPLQPEMDVVPYSVYREEQERAGLSTFAHLQSLVFLRAFHCGIKEVNWEMFNGLHQLEYLSLEANQIPFLHEFSFIGAPNLKHLVLSHNKLLDLQSTSLAGLFDLETLDMSYNNISHLTEFSLPPLPSLVTADFHHNPLEMILPFSFAVINNTRQLFLGSKSHSLQINPYSFVGLDKLHKMSINGVHLEVLERDYLKGMPHLREIRIEGKIHELSFDAFAEVPKLKELILKNCSIRKISMDAFYGLYELIYLDLSYNELETLPPSLFDHQKSLKEINLYNNKLTTLPTGIFIHTRAKLIRLDKNPWHCTCSMNDWQTSQINKVKERLIDDSLCQTRYDKGSMCSIHYKYQYTYDQSVTPRCATPVRYHGWSVFHLLRKHLRCDKKIHKHKKLKGNKKINEADGENQKRRPNHSTNHDPEKMGNLTENAPSTLFTSESRVTANSGPQLKIESTPATEEETKTTEQSQNNEPDPVYDIPDNQHMWTERNKEKYKLLLKKEKMLEKKLKSMMIKKEKTPDNFKIHIDPETKKKKHTDSQEKWKSKMKTTEENMKRVLRNGTDIS